MEKFKKIWQFKKRKIIPLFTTIGLLSIVPLVATSCQFVKNKNETDDSKNDGSSIIPSNPDNPSPPFDSQKFLPSLNESISTNGNADFYSTNDLTNLIQQQLNNENNLKRLIKNISDYQSDLSNMQVSVTNKIIVDNNSWGDVGYESWKQLGNRVMYSSKADIINITSLSDLKQKINDKQFLLKILANCSLVNPNPNLTGYKYFGLYSNSNYGLDNDGVHINAWVAKNSDSSEDITSIGLNVIIPYQQINFVVDNINISVSGSDVNTVNGTLKINYIYIPPTTSN